VIATGILRPTTPSRWVIGADVNVETGLNVAKKAAATESLLGQSNPDAARADLRKLS
jgi:hypothetical protein